MKSFLYAEYERDSKEGNEAPFYGFKTGCREKDLTQTAYETDLTHHGNQEEYEFGVLPNNDSFEIEDKADDADYHLFQQQTNHHANHDADKDQDIQPLYGEVGPLRAAHVEYYK